MGKVMTALGGIPAPDLPEGALARIALRPHDVRPATEGIPARLQERVFLGAASQLKLTVDGLAMPLVLQVFTSCPALPGDIIPLQVDADATARPEPAAHPGGIPRSTTGSPQAPEHFGQRHAAEPAVIPSDVLHGVQTRPTAMLRS